MLVTSSYVNVPPIVTFPLNVPVVAFIDPKLVAVIAPKVETPATVIPAFISTGYVLKVAAVPVTILSVDATPMSPEPSPIKDDAVIIPDEFIFLEVISPVVI